jgi:hypothetical protein
VALRLAGRGGLLGRLAQQRLATHAVDELVGQLLAGPFLGLHAHRPDALEAEVKRRRLHVFKDRPQRAAT